MVGRGVGGFIGSWLGIGVLVEFKSGNHGEVGLEVRGGFFTGMVEEPLNISKLD